MTQYHAPMDVEQQYGKPVRTSGIAIASLVCSLIFFCPITTIIGPILGLIGLLTISEARGTKGKGLAAVGLVLGVVLTVGWCVVGYFFIYKPMQFVVAGPTVALQAGFAGDAPAFRAEFYPEPSSDAEATAFIDELRDRYGAFSAGQISQPPPSTPGQTSAVAQYELRFADATMLADVELIYADQQGGKPWVMKFGYITVLDSELGDLTYPPATGDVEPPIDEAPGDEG